MLFVGFGDNDTRSDIDVGISLNYYDGREQRGTGPGSSELRGQALRVIF